jgi:hypothetical protein
MLENTKIKFDFTGEVGIHPRLGRLTTDNTISEVIANNYLKPLKQDGYVFYSGDFVFCNCSDGNIIGYITITDEDIDITQIAP